jgi:hypothetical protein
MCELPDLRHPALAARGRHPILAVYDGSAASKHALAYAAGLARRTDRWLIRAVAERRADALVIGASQWLTRAPMTVRVLRRAACPAVVVP